MIFGGSQGAHAINMAMVEAAPRLAAHPGGLAVTHQTGERDLERVRDGYRAAGLEARVEPFLFAMDREMKAADLVICRAGATTLAELTAAGKPVGARSAADGRRRSPAQERGGCRRRAAPPSCCAQSQMTGETLAQRIIALASDAPRRDAMSEAARRLAKPDAATAIVDRAFELCWRRSVMLGRTRRIHFVGIGGIGMSGIAELLANLGYEVSGSDAKRSKVTDRLEQLGVRFFVGHDAANVGSATSWWCRRPSAPAIRKRRRRCGGRFRSSRAPRCWPS